MGRTRRPTHCKALLVQDLLDMQDLHALLLWKLFFSPFQLQMSCLSIGWLLGFQLLFSNTQTIDDVSVMTDAEGSWKDGEIYFGFNILRVF